MLQNFLKMVFKQDKIGGTKIYYKEDQSASNISLLFQTGFNPVLLIVAWCLRCMLIQYRIYQKETLCADCSPDVTRTSPSQVPNMLFVAGGAE